MKEKIIIPKGFELKITSWENEGVSYDTVSTIGLTENQVRFILNVSHFFNYKSSADVFMGKAIQEEKNLFKLLLEENQKWIADASYNEIKEILPKSKKNVHLWFYKHILGFPCLNPYGYCRVFSDFQIFHHVDEKTLIVREGYNGKPNCIKNA